MRWFGENSCKRSLILLIEKINEAGCLLYSFALKESGNESKRGDYFKLKLMKLQLSRNHEYKEK